HPTEVVFTSGGTEADNLAVLGTYAARTRSDPLARGVVSSTIEHHAVLEPVEVLERRGAEVRLVAPEPSGILSVEAVVEAIEDLERMGTPAALVSLMWANNEIGTIQPVREVAEVARARGIVVHTDAVQAAGPCPISFTESSVDLMALSAHKLGGPMGIGVLLAVRDATLEPVVHGGGHERGLRSGTLPVAAIAGCAAAVEDAVRHRAE